MNARKPFYRECRNEINQQAKGGHGASVDEVIKLTGIDFSKGIQEIITCAIQQWGMVPKSALGMQ